MTHLAEVPSIIGSDSINRSLSISQRTKGTLFCGPSGSGKTTIVQLMMKKFPELAFSVSATTRDKRQDEIHGKHYYFLTPEDFQEKSLKGEFLEWEQVYESPKGFYGTLVSEVIRLRDNKSVIIFDVDVKGAMALKTYADEWDNRFDLATFFIQAPSIDIARERIYKRQSEKAETLEMRVNRIPEELTYADHFDHKIINDDLEETLFKVSQILHTFL